MDRGKPIRRFHKAGSPASGNDPMNIQILGAGTEVDPFPFFEDYGADFSALADPISQDRNEGDLILGRDPREDRRIPNRDVGKIQFARSAVAIRNIDPPIIASGDS